LLLGTNKRSVRFVHDKLQTMAVLLRERLGIWVAIWPVSLLVLSQIVEKKMQE
jgi:hypothetical protein